MRKRIVGLISVLLAAVMAFGATEALAGVRTENGATVYAAEDPDNLLGMAADFGVFAESVEFGGDTESNIACKFLENWDDMRTTCGKYYYFQYVGMKLDENGNIVPAVNYSYWTAPYGPGWFRSNLNGAKRIMYSDTFDKYKNVFPEFAYPSDNEYVIYVGSSYKLNDYNNGNGTTIIDGDYSTAFEKNNVKLKVLKENASTPFIDIEGELKNLENTALEIAAYEPTITGNNKIKNKTLECKSDENVVNLTIDELVKGAGGDILYISGLENNERTLIINVDIPAGKKRVEIPKISVDGKRLNETALESTRILWNFKSYSGEITFMDGGSGTILAPCALVNLQTGYLVGRIIARKAKNGAEVHQVPFKFKKRKPKETEVTVTVNVLDGTCCDKTLNRNLVGVKLTLFKKNENGKFKKISTKETDANGNASWTFGKGDDGEYYIYEKYKSDYQAYEGYNSANGLVDASYLAQTPVKCFFKVEKDTDGIRKIYGKADAKEGNGESVTFKPNNDNTAGSFKLRHYGNSLYMAAYKAGQKVNLLSKNYTFKVTNISSGEELTVKEAEGLHDDDNKPYDIMEVNLKEAGQYMIEMYSNKNGNLVETKFADIYMMPNGAYACVELEFGDLATAFEAQLGSKYNISKITKTAQKNMIELMKNGDFDAMTDGCLFFNVGKNDAELVLPAQPVEGGND